MSVQVCHPFFDWIFLFFILSYRCFLYTLEINPLSVTSFADNFFHSESCLCLVYGFFCCGKDFKFDQVPFVYFYFHSFRRWVIKDLAVIYAKECSGSIFSKSCIVSGLTFRSLSHFQFIFVYDFRKCSNFIFFFLHESVQFSQNHLLKKTVFSPSCILASLVIDQVTTGVRVYLQDLYPVPLIYVSVWCQYHHVLVTVALPFNLKSGRLISPALFFFLRMALAIHDLFISLQIISFFVLFLRKMLLII